MYTLSLVLISGIMLGGKSWEESSSLGQWVYSLFGIDECYPSTKKPKLSYPYKEPALKVRSKKGEYLW